MRLSQKKNCNGCKGGYLNGLKQVCDLRFKVKTDNFAGIPIEPCYKPLTNDDLMNVLDILRGQRNRQSTTHNKNLN